MNRYELSRKLLAMCFKSSKLKPPSLKLRISFLGTSHKEIKITREEVKEKFLNIPKTTKTTLGGGIVDDFYLPHFPFLSFV